MLLQLIYPEVLEQILESFVNKWSRFSLSSLKQNTPNKSFTFSTYTGMICFSCQFPFHPETILSRLTAAPTTLLGEHRDCGGAFPLPQPLACSAISVTPVRPQPSHKSSVVKHSWTVPGTLARLRWEQHWLCQELLLPGQGGRQE